MSAEHEKENVNETDAHERGQSSSSPNHEKGASDQNFQISEVGHKGNDRNHREAAQAHQPDGRAARSHWFDDQTKEIGDAPSGSQFEFGWIYRRSETGHRRERTHNRDSVS